MTPPKLIRYCILFALILLSLSGVQGAFAQPEVQAVNLSTRMLVQTGARVGIGGFIISGSASKQVLIRAIGPSLTHNGIVDVLADPMLECPTCSVTSNNNWKDNPLQRDEIESTLIPPTNDLESAIIANLDSRIGGHTVIVKGNGNTTGVALIEVYDLDPAVGKLANLSTRAFVSTADNVVIAGVLLSSGAGDDQIAVRGMGPSLGPSVGGIPTLADPTLELRDNNGTLRISNNDWADDPGQMNQIILADLAPASLESALIITLPPGLYTALLAGSNNTTGIGLVEIYDL